MTASLDRHGGRTRLGIVTGMVAEARCIARPSLPFETRILCSGARAAQARAASRRLIDEGATALMSFGLGGGLAGGLRPGQLVLAERVVLPDGTALHCDARWRASLLRLASRFDLAVHVAAIAGSDEVVSHPDQKRALGERTGAHVVDMESHIVARTAGDAGLPFAALRAVADPADSIVPSIALAGLRADGTTNPMSVAARLALRPGSFPALLRLSRDSARALASLRRIAAAGLPGPWEA